MNLRGAFTALVTPFRKGKVDFRAFERQVDFQVRGGVAGVVPCGTTGESPTLSHKEHRDVIAAAVRAAARRALVVAGTGSNSTDEAVELTRFAKKAGCDAVLSVVPYYNKPTQEGLYRHFRAVAASSRLPVVLYNIPGRCGVGLAPATLRRLAELDNIVAVKESTGSMDQATETLDAGLAVLSGDDSLTLPLLALGAEGVVSVVSNLFPADVAELVRSFHQGRTDRARALHRALFPLVKSLFVETNPIPVKTAMRIQKRDAGTLRLPLCPMKKENEALLRKELGRYRTARARLGLGGGRS
jgi:4-hydroxy-tetrahydrodipicolinate synthase